MYDPLRVFSLLSLIPFTVALLGILRYAWYTFFSNTTSDLTTTLIISGVCISIGVTLFALGIIGDVIAKNRILLEQQLDILKQRDIKVKNERK